MILRYSISSCHWRKRRSIDAAIARPPAPRSAARFSNRSALQRAVQTLAYHESALTRLIRPQSIIFHYTKNCLPTRNSAPAGALRSETLNSRTVRGAKYDAISRRSLCADPLRDERIPSVAQMSEPQAGGAWRVSPCSRASGRGILKPRPGSCQLLALPGITAVIFHITASVGKS